MVKRLSIKRLNGVLNSSSRDFFLQTFSSVDIAFIAGLLLDYETKKNGSWKKKAVTYSLVDPSGGFEIRQYFQQYKELYGVDWKDVYTQFSYALKDDNAETPNVFSETFAPILYITKDTINYLFAQKQNESNTESDKLTKQLKEGIEKIKKAYIAKFSILEFVHEDFYKKQEIDFIDHEKYIKETLQNSSSPIFTFILMITQCCT